MAWQNSSCLGLSPIVNIPADTLFPEKTMRALLLDSLDPTFNLAVEESLFQSVEPGQSLFLLWRNRPSVIVGRHQNTVEEVNQNFVCDNSIDVVRRMSGGGAVYHDEGNINFSFLVWNGEGCDQGFARFLEPVTEALADLGLHAEYSSRNDITISGRKVSGSAQRRSGSRLLHHGTLLVDLDMDRLGQALSGHPDKYTSKGVPSHRARVVNLKELLPPDWSRDACLERVQAALLNRCARHRVGLSPAQQEAAQRLADSRYRTWEWNYGQSPPYTEKRRQRFPWGAVDCRLEVCRGIIRSCRIFGDFFSVEGVSELEARLTGMANKTQTLRKALENMPLSRYFVGCDPRQMLDFLCGDR